MSGLSPCTSCARHVRRDEHTCPFCGVELKLGPEPARRTLSERVTRNVLYTIGPAILIGAAATLDACSAADYGGHHDSGGGYDAHVVHDAGITGGDSGGPDGAAQ